MAEKGEPMPASRCGLLYIPVLREYRGPVEGVMAVDAETGRAIPDANIRFVLAKYDNWTFFPPRLVQPSEHSRDWGKLSERDPPGVR